MKNKTTMKLDLDWKCKCLYIEVRNISKSYSMCILIILPAIAEILILILLKQFIEISGILLLIVIALFFIILYIHAFFSYILSTLILSCIGVSYCNQFFKNENEHTVANNPTKEYAAVLISNAQSSSVIECCLTRCWKNVQVNSATAFLPKLIKYFENRNINYRLIQAVTKENLDEVISEINCIELYLIGHGSRGIFKTSETSVHYSDYNKTRYTDNKKRIVSQLHCNGLEYAENYIEGNKKNTSLTHILAIDQKDSFFTEGYITLFDIYLYFYHLSREKDRMKHTEKAMKKWVM